MKRLFEFLLLISFVLDIVLVTTDPGNTNLPESGIIEPVILAPETGTFNTGNLEPPTPNPSTPNSALGNNKPGFLAPEPGIYNPGGRLPACPHRGTTNPYKPKGKCKDGEMKNGKCICPKNKILSKGVCIDNPLSKKCKNGKP